MNIYDEHNWGVHVIGPDNVLAARSFEEAAEKAAFLNGVVANVIKKDPKFITYAQVCLWENVTSAQHNPEDTDWDNPFE